MLQMNKPMWKENLRQQSKRGLKKSRPFSLFTTAMMHFWAGDSQIHNNDFLLHFLVFVSFLALICASIVPDLIVNLPKKCPLWPGPSNWGWEPDRSPHPSPRTPHPLPISHKTIYQENCFFYNLADCKERTHGLFVSLFVWLLVHLVTNLCWFVFALLLIVADKSTHPPLDVSGLFFCDHCQCSPH